MKTGLFIAILACAGFCACEKPVTDKYEQGSSDSFVVQYWTFDRLEAVTVGLVGEKWVELSFHL